MKDFSLPDIDRLKSIGIWGGLATIAFPVIYGFCNHYASGVENHYAMYTQWELSIPLLPWMIIPYLSLNLLFVVAAFILKTPTVIKAYCLSLVLGALMAAVIFIIFPGELGFVRQGAPYFTAIFEGMYAIDKPHNLYPSLHVTYSSLSIWAMLEQSKNKILHAFLWVWLFLISFSVVFVHQHHLFDIVTGWILALIIWKTFYCRLHPNGFKPAYLW
ncbi:MAG: phosphatase PAP2 family protein [Oligoflexia bacterium]|nr:phosphatase PAP2 family protein [Oligoflexia bacterium]